MKPNFHFLLYFVEFFFSSSISMLVFVNDGDGGGKTGISLSPSVTFKNI